MNCPIIVQQVPQVESAGEVLLYLAVLVLALGFGYALGVTHKE